MEPRIEFSESKLMVGLSTSTSLTNNQSGKLWADFMPKLNMINNRKSNELYSLQVYPGDYFVNFNPATDYVKYALTEVSLYENIPSVFEKFVLPAGLYAVFIHKGAQTNFTTFKYIFEEWIPNSVYKIDNRPHFEILGDRYKNFDVNSEEEVWIPIIKKSDFNN